MKLIKDLTEEEFDDLLFFQTPLSKLDGIDIDDKIIVFNNPFFICYEKWPYSGMEYLGFTGTLQLSTYIGISFFIYDDVRHFLFYRVSRKVCNSIYSSKLCLYYLSKAHLIITHAISYHF